MEKKILKIEKKNVKYLGYKECGEGYDTLFILLHSLYPQKKIEN